MFQGSKGATLKFKRDHFRSQGSKGISTIKERAPAEGAAEASVVSRTYAKG